MPASRILTAQNPLYLICDGEACAAHGISLVEFCTAALKGGCQTIQYRHKNIGKPEYRDNLRQILASTAARPIMLIVNDHADVAEEFALPLHLGQGDALPPALSVPYGRSTHSLDELAAALRATPAPDYVALGTMFASATKPEVETQRGLVMEYVRLTNLPLVLIGGITLDNVGLLPQGERFFYAVIADVFRFGAAPPAIERYAAAWRDRGRA